MKEIKVFLASSIVEFAEERLELSDYFRQLGDILRETAGIRLRLEKCENMDNCVDLSGKQTGYDDAIRTSDLAVFLFGARAGEYTIGELDVAAEHFGIQSDRILIFCTQSLRNADEPSLQTLADRLNRYRLSAARFAYIDTLKHGILYRLLQSGLLQDALRAESA